MNSKLSKECNFLIKQGFGFRNDNVYNSGIIDVFSIIDFEVFELGNTDILKTCKKLYNLQMDLRNKKKAVSIIKNFLINYFGSSTLFGLWLSTYKGVLQYYDGQENLSCYTIPKNCLIISDLGSEGILFVNVNPLELSELC